MPGEVATNTIGGVTYRMTPLGARSSGHVALRAGKPLLDVFKARDRASFMAGLADGLRGVSDEDFDFVLGKFAESTSFDLEDPRRPGSFNAVKLGTVFDDHFRGRFDDLLAFAAWGMEVNFKSFFGGLRALFARAQEFGSSSPPKSPESGSSGDSSSASE